jgi:hypothetical protein
MRKANANATMASAVIAAASSHSPGTNGPLGRRELLYR